LKQLEVVIMRRSLVIVSATRGQIARRVAILAASLLLLPVAAFAQSPWERAASNLEATFTGPLARSLALVAIVIGGLMFMFGEGGAKRQISGIVFGGGLALFAAQFLAWLF
jgi:type IV secretory pathway VirB2 component (pilin)